MDTLWIVILVFFAFQRARGCSKGYFRAYLGPITRCIPCYKNCPECSYSSCLSCKEGYFGYDCQTRCSSKCDSGKCRQHDGFCTCFSGYYTHENYSYQYKRNVSTCRQCANQCTSCLSASVCTACKPGRYGKACDEVCQNCRNDICNIKTGQCEHGCKDGYYQYNGRCSKCPRNCDKCSSNSKCEECRIGYFGISCQKECPGNCLSCHKTSGKCSYCNTGAFGEQCKKCSKKCLDGCRHTGIECDGCIDGFANINGLCKSCKRCENSTTCLLMRVCPRCLHGYWGKFCENKCKDTCKTCNKQSSECNECKDDTFGEFCELKCSQYCVPLLYRNSSCWQENGTCIDGCVAGFTGITCNIGESTASSSIVIGISGGAAVLIAIVVVTVINRFRRRRTDRYTLKNGRVQAESTSRRRHDSLNSTYEPIYITSVAMSSLGNGNEHEPQPAAEAPSSSGDAYDDVLNASSLGSNPDETQYLQRQHMDKSNTYDKVSNVTVSCRNVPKCQNFTLDNEIDTYSHINHASLSYHRYHEGGEYDHVVQQNGSPRFVDNKYDVVDLSK